MKFGEINDKDQEAFNIYDINNIWLKSPDQLREVYSYKWAVSF